MWKWLKNLALFCAVAVRASLFMWGVAASVRPELSQRPSPYTPEQVAAAEKARDVSFDREHTPTLYRHIHVEPKNESPILKDLVDAGKLPPLKDRLPKEPAVMEGVDGIGKYGGTWLRLAATPSEVLIIGDRLSGATYVRWSPLGYPIEPHVAKSVEPNADKTEWTITLREGMRWSDGHPYTTDDVKYWWEYEANNKLVNAALPAWLVVGGKPAKFVILDKTH